jgi:hypothetical protein
MFTALIAVSSFLAFDTPGAVVLDRIAVVVGMHVIKSSDIDHDLRITAFLNRAPLIVNATTKNEAADRLIDQQIIRQEIATGEYPRATDSEAAVLFNQIRNSRFGGSDIRMRAELSRYGLTEAEFQSQLLWQLTVLKFITERFQAGLMVSDDDVRKYYDQHLTELKRQYPKDFSFATLEPNLREILEGEQANKQFVAWLEEARGRVWIEFHQEAFK